ncbi:MAG: membrane protein insertion efficiency factor YidD [Candidatus Cloacimonetes bacterium]|nr:membrane protein insertion efficiency factor YidD [Candidatus Cloacimonadota bacterium]
MIFRFFLIAVILLLCTHLECKNSNLDYGSGNNSFLNFYQKWISPIKGGDTCPMHPSCSQYAKISFETNSFFAGYINTFSRLIECGRDRHLYFKILDDNKIKSLDLPENFEPQFVELPDTTFIPVIENFSEIADSLMNNSYYNLAEKYYLIEYFQQRNIRKKKKLLLKYFKTCFYTKNASQYYPEFMKYRSLYKNDADFNAKLKLLTGAKLYHSNEFGKCYQILSYEKFTDSKEEQIRKKMVLASAISEHNWSTLDYELKQDSELFSFSEFNISGYNQQIDNIPFKNPKKAYWMSLVIPGSGHFYAGRKSTGFAAFVLNGLWMWSAYELFDKEIYSAGTTVSFICLGWYLGAAKGASKSVRKYNELQEQQLAKRFLGDFKIYDLFESIAID